jgi:hypothetical protein
MRNSRAIAPPEHLPRTSGKDRRPRTVPRHYLTLRVRGNISGPKCLCVCPGVGRGWFRCLCRSNSAGFAVARSTNARDNSPTRNKGRWRGNGGVHNRAQRRLVSPVACPPLLVMTTQCRQCC